MHRRPAAAALLLSAALAGGCAAPLEAPDADHAAASAGCEALAESIAATEQLRRAAAQKQDAAWKAIVPFAVAGVYASAHAEREDAERRLSRLRDESQRQGCAS